MIFTFSVVVFIVGLVLGYEISKSKRPQKEEFYEFPQELVKKVILEIGDIRRPGLLDTPRRVAEMWREMYKGYDAALRPKLTVFGNKNDGVKVDEMIIDKGYFYSQCEHHMLPFFGTYSFGYIPDKKVIGLSKVARVVEWHASRLQVQERLTSDVVGELEKLLKPKGIMLVLEARHLCKEMRGIKQVNSKMITSDARGVFRKNQAARQEFLSLIKNNG